MLYKFLNKRIGNKITKLHPIVMKYLSSSLELNSDNGSVERLKVFRNYTLLYKHFESDQKRLYMINNNYLKFLKAIIFLYQTSRVSISAGILTAPSKFYSTIHTVQESFEYSINSLNLK